jgi:hypothetical protein
MRGKLLPLQKRREERKSWQRADTVLGKSAQDCDRIALLTTVSRGPEVETWLGAEEGTDPATDNDWSLLPFMALTDGAHASAEDYSYFTLRRAHTSTDPATSLFGISCTRQLDASKLIDRPVEVTRSTVQKAVVVISDSPQHFGAIKAQLGIVTQLWFAQRYVPYTKQASVIMVAQGSRKEDQGEGIIDLWRHG